MIFYAREKKYKLNKRKIINFLIKIVFFKISGSAYKVNLGKTDGSGKKALHHGTMLIDV